MPSGNLLDGRAVSLVLPGGDVFVSSLVATRCTCDDGNTANGTAAMRNAASTRAGTASVIPPFASPQRKASRARTATRARRTSSASWPARASGPPPREASESCLRPAPFSSFLSSVQRNRDRPHDSHITEVDPGPAPGLGGTRLDEKEVTLTPFTQPWSPGGMLVNRPGGMVVQTGTATRTPRSYRVRNRRTL
jgi:hypothetical protein